MQTYELFQNKTGKIIDTVTTDRYKDVLERMNELNAKGAGVTARKEGKDVVLNVLKKMDNPEPQPVANYDHVVYTDGSNTSDQASWAFVVMDGDVVIFEDKGLVDTTNYPDVNSMRNVAGECAAAMRAVNWASKHNKKIRIIYDYKGVEHWALGTWKRKNEYTQAYHGYMSDHLEVVTGFQHVRGHTGVYGNERADYLAKVAIGVDAKEPSLRSSSSVGTPEFAPLALR